MNIMKIFKKENMAMDESVFWELEYEKSTDLFVKDVGVEVFNGLERKRIPLQGFWDTGASSCAISKDIIKQLGLRPHKTGIETTSMNGSSRNDIYLMNVYITRTMLFKNVEVQATNLGNHPCKFVIGLNIIKKGDLSFINKDGYLIGKFERKEFN